MPVSAGAARLWITLAARWLLGAPYVRADLAVGAGDGVRYLGTRAGSWDYQLDVQPGLPLSPSDLDIWLTHRWRPYTEHAGYLLQMPVRHEPWPLRRAAVTRLDQSVTTAAGLPRPVSRWCTTPTGSPAWCSAPRARWRRVPNAARGADG